MADLGGAAGLDEPGAAREPLDRLMRDLRSGPKGLSSREAARRLTAHGPNVLVRRRGAGWWRELGSQLVHPLALLLWAAALLAAVAGTTPLAIAIVAVVLLNAVVAFVQERHAERAVEALRRYLPPHAAVLRDGRRQVVEARDLVPGDILLIAEGDRISADARLVQGGVVVDLSSLTGESQPVLRSAGAEDVGASLIEAPDLVFSGTTCGGGEARALVFATGMRTELGRVAALSQRVRPDRSPLERQVRRVAWLIAVIAVAAGGAFLLLGTLGAGLGLAEASEFAIGLLVANVPEGLLPTITLALAVGVRAMGRRGAIVKRLSAVETIGAASVICTDKTGTLTQNRMRAAAAWTAAGPLELEGTHAPPPEGSPASTLARRAAACTSVEIDPDAPGDADPTEVAILDAARRLGAQTGVEGRRARRRAVHRFDPALRLMTSIDEDAGELWIATKGAPEAVLARCRWIAGEDGERRPLDGPAAARALEAAERLARRGLRVLAVAQRPVGADGPAAAREQVESDLELLGLVAMHDPPRPGVEEAVGRCRAAGIRVIMVTGDSGPTAEAVARRVGIVTGTPRIVTGAELDRMEDADLDRLLREEAEVVFARSSPEAKLRIADSLRAEGHVIAMTGDGVNDAPALRRADIGVAMGRSGTEVAREASTMVLTDDDFATIVDAVHEGRRVYHNVRKFILYIFAHAPPEVVPFLAFALSGGAIPLPLTVMQILAIDLGTETLPALALGREPAEPGIMAEPPRRRGANVVDAALLRRAWGVLGAVSAALVMGVFLLVLWRAGWSPGDPVGEGSPLHASYVEATTMTFLAIVACQLGTAVACRTEHASLRSVGLLSNRLLLWGIAFELAVTAAVVALPALQGVFGTAVPDAGTLALLLPLPVVVWGADALWRRLARREERSVVSRREPPGPPRFPGARGGSP